MVQASRRRPHLTLNTDGQRHPRENALAFVALALGLVAFGTGLARDLHVVSATTGLAGLALGLFDQMVSATRGERMVIIPAIVASAVGLILGMAHGGFAP
jgi:hypothetical protein